MLEKDKKNISVVITTLKPKNNLLTQFIENIKNQSLKPNEVIIIRNVKPRTKAHNLGVKNSKGKLIIFFDDDIQFGNKNIIKNLITPFLKNKKIGMTGAHIKLTKKSTLFQKMCASQLLRSNFPIIKNDIESGAISHAALCISKELYQKIGGENEQLKLNDDALLAYKIKRENLKIIIAGNSWVYHPQPKNIKDLIKKYFSQGIDQSSDYRLKPEFIFNTETKQEGNIEKSTLANQILRNIKIILNAIFKLKFLLLISRVSTGLGFTYGYIFKRQNIYNNHDHEDSIEKIKIN